MTMWSPLASLLLCARAARYRPLTGTAAFVVRVCVCVCELMQCMDVLYATSSVYSVSKV